MRLEPDTAIMANGLGAATLDELRSMMVSMNDTVNGLQNELTSSRIDQQSTETELRQTKVALQAMSDQNQQQTAQNQSLVIGLQQRILEQGTRQPKVEPIIDLRQINRPAPLKGKDSWESFRFNCENYLSFADASYSDELEFARTAKDGDLESATQSDATRDRSIKLFAMLSSWTQDSAEAQSIVKGEANRNGFDLWRRLNEHFDPVVLSKGLVWRRQILNPIFPKKEADFQLAHQD